MAEVYSLLVTPRKRGAGSAELISIYSNMELNRADFDRVKRVGFLLYHWESLTKACYRLLIKTLKNHITCGKWASDDPFKGTLCFEDLLKSLWYSWGLLSGAASYHCTCSTHGTAAKLFDYYAEWEYSSKPYQPRKSQRFIFRRS